MSTTSDIFLLVVAAVMRHFPELRVDHPAAWRVHDALTTATFSEWKRFTRNGSKDTFYSTSQYSRKKGARDARYAVVSHLPPIDNQAVTHCHLVRGLRRTDISTKRATLPTNAILWTPPAHHLG